MEIQHLRAIWLETVDQSGQLVVRQMMLKTVRAVQIERVENRCPITRLEATPRGVAISGYIAHGAERGLLQQETEERNLTEDSHGARVGQSPRKREVRNQTAKYAVIEDPSQFPKQPSWILLVAVEHELATPDEAEQRGSRFLHIRRVLDDVVANDDAIDASLAQRRMVDAALNDIVVLIAGWRKVPLNDVLNAVRQIEHDDVPRSRLEQPQRLSTRSSARVHD